MKVKKILAVLISIFLLVAILPCSVAQAEDITLREAFPDTNFRAFVKSNYLTTYNDDDPMDLTAQNILSAVTATLDVSNKSISDLTGVGYFTGIISLNCSNNNLTSLDVSNNTGLVSLLAAGQTVKLEYQNVGTMLPSIASEPIPGSGNYIYRGWTYADRQFKKLTVALDDQFRYNFAVVGGSWGSVGVTVTLNGTTFGEAFPDENFRTEVRGILNNKLGIVYIDDSIIDENISNTIAGIDVLNLNNRSISNLTGIERFTLLWKLRCANNNLTSLNFSGTNISDLDCSNNQISSLVLRPGGMEYLHCENNHLLDINVTDGIVWGTEDPISFTPQSVDMQVETIGSNHGVRLPENATAPKDGTLVGCIYDSANRALILTDFASRPSTIEYVYKAFYGYDGITREPMYKDVQVIVNLSYNDIQSAISRNISIIKSHVKNVIDRVNNGIEAVKTSGQNITKPVSSGIETVKTKVQNITKPINEGMGKLRKGIKVLRDQSMKKVL